MAGNFELQRRQLVEYMVTSQAIQSEAVKQAFLAVKRELFLPEHMREYSYQDDAMPIGFNQTISQPSTIAVMLELLQAEKGQNVLEVGSGCGYVLALLAEIVGGNGNSDKGKKSAAGKKGKVFGIEILPELVEMSRENLKKASNEKNQKETPGVKNIEIKQGDGGKGWKENAPFDRILISAACPFVPKPLFDQLKDGGRIVAPVGDKFSQEMQIVKKIKGKLLKENYLLSQFVFVPLQGEHGFRRFEVGIT